VWCGDVAVAVVGEAARGVGCGRAGAAEDWGGCKEGEGG